MKKNYLKVVAVGMMGLMGSLYAQTTQTFNYTGTVQSFTVPSCVSKITITCNGANGADGSVGGNTTSIGGKGGLGATVTGTVDVTPGQVLQLYVGGAASGLTGGYNGGGQGKQVSGGPSGGGGGASDVRLNGTALTDRILVAGGGGGGGNGGTATLIIQTALGGNGGAGGGDNGVNGENSDGGSGGKGGAGTIGGIPGTGCSGFIGKTGGNGSTGLGGDGGDGGSCCTYVYANGGGGGGGYTGGGAGGGSSLGTSGCQNNETGGGGGGAGGTNYISSAFSNTLEQNGMISGNGSIVITYTINASPSIDSTTGNSVCDSGKVVLYATSTVGTIDWYDAPLYGQLLGSGTNFTTPSISTTTVYYAEANNNGCLSATRTAVTATVNKSTSSDTTAIACNSFTWYGNTYTTSGVAYRVVKNKIGCDSSITLHLTINKATTGDTTAVACNSFTWYGNTYTASGDPTQLLKNAAGCDSTLTLHLTIHNSTSSDTTAVACNSFNWYGNTFTTSGNPTRVVKNANGCDSIITLHLTINTITTGDTTAVACNNFTWYGKMYTASGNPTHIFTNASGCDSILTLHLTINTTAHEEMAAIACDNYTWFGNMLTASGDYIQILTSAVGCDSILTLHLTIKKSTTSEFSATACNSYLWDEYTYTASGDYTHQFTNAAGCDSSITLHLTIKTLDQTLTVQNDSVFSNEDNASYQWIDMDNHTIIEDATKQGFAVRKSGHYAVLLDNGTCTDTSFVVRVNSTGINNYSKEANVSVYPNPSTGVFTVAYTGSKPATVKIINMVGKVIYEEVISNPKSVIDIATQAPGIYFVQLVTASGSSEHKIIKR